jgi:endonuclease/exonuclease/phosphatase family metal-dependent hydrolase
MSTGKVVCVFLMLLLLVSEVQSSNFKNKETRLKVMTYNIHHCNPPSAGDKIDIEAIAKVINSAKPDLVALQEVDVNTIRSGKGINQAKELARLTGMYYYFSKAIDFQGGDYGVAVLSRYPIVDSVRYDLPVLKEIGGEPRTIAAITVLLPGKKKIIFACTHLDLHEENRLSQSQLIINHFGQSKLPMVLAGDFNATPGSKVINYLDEHFKRSCQPDCAPTIPVENPEEAIDFIMLRPGKSFKVSTTQVVDEKYASDHLPVVSELKF